MPDNHTYEMQQLQKDAIRRAREMQSRAQIASPSQNYPLPRPVVATQDAPPISRPAPPKPPVPVQSIPVQSAPQAPPHEHNVPLGSNPSEHDQPKNQLDSIGDIFESLLSDSERTLILALILLLVEEKADTGLIFALMYLAL